MAEIKHDSFLQLAASKPQTTRAFNRRTTCTELMFIREKDSKNSDDPL